MKLRFLCPLFVGWLPALLVFLAGCGQDGPPRYTVSGAVTYDGRPVSAGRVIFEPDTDRGNHGPAAYADITEGYYETNSGRGTIGGPQRVRVICLSGKTDNLELPDGGMICPEYRTEVDLPAEDSEQDFAVPGSLKW